MHARRGFTLLEVTVALLLLVFILFSIAVLIPLSQVRVRNTAHRDVALMLADDMIGKIRAINGDLLPVFTDDNPLTFPPQTAIAVSGEQILPPKPYPSTIYDFYASDAMKKVTPHTVIYTYTVILQRYENPDIPGARLDDLLEVTVSVLWNESTGSGGSTQKSVTRYSTLLRRI